MYTTVKYLNVSYYSHQNRDRSIPLKKVVGWTHHSWTQSLVFSKNLIVY